MWPRWGAWARRRAASLIARHGEDVDFGRALHRVQRNRARVSEVEASVLHFWLLPAREDLQTLRRRVHRLRAEVGALEGAVERLERALDEQGSAS